MSIIYEALKKVETNVDKPDNNPLQFKIHNKSRLKFYNYFIYVSVLCCGVFAAFLFFKFIFPEGQLIGKKISPKIAPQPEAKPQERKTANAAPKSAQKIPSTSKTNLLLPPETQAKTTPIFVVSGVFFSENQGFTIINDHVLKEGDVIEGATVARINADAVILKYEDVVIELSPGSN